MPSGEQRALWAAIRAAPGDDTPRLVYADWLDDHGDPARAEFIRVQVRLAQLGPDRRKGRKERLPLETREKMLLAAHQERWAGPLCRALAGDGTSESPADWLDRLTFHRGFIRVLYLGFGSILRLVSGPTDLEPVDEIDVTDCQANYRPGVVRQIAQWEGAGRVTRLSVAGATDTDVEVIVTADRMTRLRGLGLWFGSIGDEGAVRLAGWPAVGRLWRLDLKRNAIGDRGAFALADSPYLEHIRYLDLYENPVGAAGRRRLRERFGDRALMEA